MTNVKPGSSNSKRERWSVNQVSIGNDFTPIYMTPSGSFSSGTFSANAAIIDAGKVARRVGLKARAPFWPSVQPRQPLFIGSCTDNIMGFQYKCYSGAGNPGGLSCAICRTRGIAKENFTLVILNLESEVNQEPETVEEFKINGNQR